MDRIFQAVTPLAPPSDDVVQDLTTLPLRTLQESELMALTELVPDQLYKLSSSYSLDAFYSLRDRLAARPLVIHTLELCQGEVYVSAAPSRDHQLAVSNLLISMTLFARRNKLGNVFPTLGMTLDPQNYLEPDLLFATQEELERCTEQGMAGPVSWVIEALSPSTQAYDRKEKRASYLEQGCRFYWTVDVRRQRVDMFTDPVSSRFERVSDPNALLSCPALPGWSMKLKHVFDSTWVMEDTETAEVGEEVHARFRAHEKQLQEEQAKRAHAHEQAALARGQVKREKLRRIYYQDRARAAVEQARAALEAHLRAQSEAETLRKERERTAEQLVETQRRADQAQAIREFQLSSAQLRVESAEASVERIKGKVAQVEQRVKDERELRTAAEIERHKANARAWADREARAQAEAQIQAEQEARRCADTQVKAERDARKAARTLARAERDARKQAEAQAKAELDARKQAEAQAKADLEARKQAEAQAAHFRSLAQSLTLAIQETAAAQQRLDTLLKQPQVLPDQLSAAAEQLRAAQARALEASIALATPAQS